MNHEWLNADAITDAKAHARSEYPKESCGFVVNGTYIAAANLDENPEQHFRIGADAQNAAEAHGTIQAILHSHPGGPLYPSQNDMAGQLASDIPWGIIGIDEDRIGDPIMWGEGVPIAPLVGRVFTHGVADCYSLIRDCYRLGKTELAAQDFKDWPYEPIDLADCAREDSWWVGDGDLYSTNFPKWGFFKVDVSEARPGDVFLMSIRSEKLNHGGVLIGDGLIAHHLPARLSRREPSGMWARQARFWLRYGGPGA